MPWEKRNVNLKLKLAKIAAAGVVIALLIGGLGHPHEIKAAWEQITSWIQTALGINENVESYIDSVGKTITKNGISITLDEIAADKENLWVAISDNINDSKEKETILLTEVEQMLSRNRRTDQMVRLVIIGWKIQLLKIIQQI